MAQRPRESHYRAVQPPLPRKQLSIRLRVLRLYLFQAITTYVSTGLLFASSLNPRMKAALTPMAGGMVKSAFLMANIQVALGISTLLYLVPIPLAALHQAGSVALLTTMIHLLISLRRPATAARLWRQANLAKTAGNTHA